MRDNLVELEKCCKCQWAFSCKNRLRYSRERTFQSCGLPVQNTRRALGTSTRAFWRARSRTLFRESDSMETAIVVHSTTPPNRLTKCTASLCTDVISWKVLHSFLKKQLNIFTMDRVFLYLADSQEQLSSFSEVPEKFDELLKEGSAVFDPNSTSARDPHGRVTSTPVEVSSLV